MLLVQFPVIRCWGAISLCSGALWILITLICIALFHILKVNWWLIRPHLLHALPSATEYVGAINSLVHNQHIIAFLPLHFRYIEVILAAGTWADGGKLWYKEKASFQEHIVPLISAVCFYTAPSSPCYDCECVIFLLVLEFLALLASEIV